MDVPCYMTIHNLVTWPKLMLPHLQRLGFRVVVCDHGSTYPPVLEWLASLSCEVRRYENHGCYGFFNRRDYLKEPGLYAVTDSDLDLSSVPADALAKMIEVHAANPWATKVGLSLEIDDIPDDLPFAVEVKGWESGHWGKRTDCGKHWVAGIGATLAIYDNRRNPLQVDAAPFYSAVRLDRPYTARHYPWYLTAEEAAREEYRQYFGRVGRLSHWSAKIGDLYGIREPGAERHGG